MPDTRHQFRTGDSDPRNTSNPRIGEMNVRLPYQQVMAGLSATESDRSLIAYAKLLIKLGIIAKCQFVHVRTPQRVAEERISDAEVLDQCQRMIAGQFTATESQGQQVCQVITAQSRIDALIEFAATHQCDLALLGHRKCQTGCRSLARRMAMIRKDPPSLYPKCWCLSTSPTTPRIACRWPRLSRRLPSFRSAKPSTSIPIRR